MLFLSLSFLHSLCRPLTPSLFHCSLWASPSHQAPLFSSETITVFFVSLPCAAAVWDSDSRKDRDESKGCGHTTCAAQSTKTGKATKWFVVACHCSITSVCPFSSSGAAASKQTHTVGITKAFHHSVSSLTYTRTVTCWELHMHTASLLLNGDVLSYCLSAFAYMATVARKNIKSKA